jgi:hypothetical protein
MPLLARHPEAKIVRVQLRQSLILKHLNARQWELLEPLLEVVDYPGTRPSSTRAHGGS